MLCTFFVGRLCQGGAASMIDAYDRKWKASTDSTYAEAVTYETLGFIDKPGQYLPKAEAYAAAGVGRAKAAFSVFEAEARGPSASAAASASLAGVSAMIGAEIASASASAGPVKAKIGLGVDTGVKIGLDGVEVKVLGTGVNLGPRSKVSFLGSELEISLF
uniref:Uncharacterized protein n=1 Tax=Paramormyrops kingsleyae TaxID=1676925 RepID=A0A3B3RAN8_9TELE